MNADRILIAETEPEVLELYRRELERVGYDIACASQEKDLLNRIREDPPDLIILDLHLGGLEVLGKVLDAAPRVPVILTSHCDIRCRDDFRSWLADAVIVKSSDVKELKQAVRRVLARTIPSGGSRPLDHVHSRPRTQAISLQAVPGTPSFSRNEDPWPRSKSSFVSPPATRS